MTLQDLAKLANECIASKSRVTLVRKKGDHCYSYDPEKIINWIEKEKP